MKGKETSMKDKTFSEQCDELSRIEAQNNHTSFGRWFIDDGYLSTWVIFPSDDKFPVRKLYTYDFLIETCKTKEKQEQWLQHMAEKTWISERSLKDLARAFKYISKKQVKDDLELES